MSTYVIRNDELYHHGILGQKWGVRRYQNADGSYTSAGRKRYEIGEDGKKSDAGKRREKGDREANYYATKAKQNYSDSIRKSSRAYQTDFQAQRKDKMDHIGVDVALGAVTGVYRARGASAATDYWRGEKYEKKLNKSLEKYGTKMSDIGSIKEMSKEHGKAGQHFIERTKNEKVKMVVTDAALNLGARAVAMGVGLPLTIAVGHTRGELKYKTKIHD